MTQERDSRSTGRLQDYGKNWDGYLTLRNLEAAAARVRNLLGGKLFSVMEECEGLGDARLRTSRCLSPSVYYRGFERPFSETGVTSLESVFAEPYEHATGYLDIHDMHGTWMLTTSRSHEAAQNGSLAPGTDAYLRFCGQSLTAEFRNCAGERRLWTFMLEEGMPPAEEEANGSKCSVCEALGQGSPHGVPAVPDGPGRS